MTRISHNSTQRIAEDRRRLLAWYLGRQDEPQTGPLSTNGAKRE
jgi:hypothetical protein